MDPPTPRAAARPDPAADTPTNMTELGGLPGAPPPPALPGVKTAPAMGVGDTVLLEMNGDKWAFIKLKRDGCVPRPTASIAPRRDVHHPQKRSHEIDPRTHLIAGNIENIPQMLWKLVFSVYETLPNHRNY